MSMRKKVIAATLAFSIFAGIIFLIISGILVFFPFHHDLWRMIDPSFSEISPCNVEFTEATIKPGDMAEYVIGRRSIEGSWHLTSVEFSPDDTSLGVWEGITTDDEKENWNKDGSMLLFNALATFQIPDDSSLEGRTIRGNITGDLSYPIQESSLWWKMNYEDIEESVSIKIFSPQEAESYNLLTERFDSVCLYTWLFFFVGGLLFLGIPFIIALIDLRRKGEL